MVYDTATLKKKRFTKERKIRTKKGVCVQAFIRETSASFIKTTVQPFPSVHQSRETKVIMILVVTMASAPTKPPTGSHVLCWLWSCCCQPSLTSSTPAAYTSSTLTSRPSTTAWNYRSHQHLSLCLLSPPLHPAPKSDTCLVSNPGVYSETVPSGQKIERR